MASSCFFFLKAPRSTRKSCKILDAHADRTQRRRGCPSSLGTRHTETHAHLHTHTHAHPHTGLSTRCDTSVAIGGIERWRAASQARALPLSHWLVRGLVMLEMHSHRLGTTKYIGTSNYNCYRSSSQARSCVGALFGRHLFYTDLCS